MTSVQSLQSSSALSKLLTFQQSNQSSATPSAQVGSSQPGVTDSLSLSSAALQALQGLGLDPTQLPSTQTYTAKGHHHHHRAPQVEQVASAQQGSAEPTAPVPQVGATDSTLFQAKG